MSTATSPPAEARPGSGRSVGRTAGALIALIIVIGFSLRLAALTDDFWLDEVMAYYLAQDLTSAWGAFHELKVEHHLLNTAYIYLLGDQFYWPLYRLPSLVAGVALIGLTAGAAWRYGRLETGLATWLVALSSPLIAFSTEARGYAPAAFFSLLAFVLVTHYWRQPTRWTLVAFWIATALALLSQLTAVYVLVSLGIASVIREVFSGRSVAQMTIEVSKVHLLPALVALALYYFVVRHMYTLGGEVYSLPMVLANTLSVVVGGPLDGRLTLTAAFAAGAILLYGCLYGYLARSRGPEVDWVIFPLVLMIAPAALLIATAREYVYVRYFAVCFPFFYLLFGRFLAELWRAGSWQRPLMVTVLSISTAGHLYATSQLISVGRGTYLDAARYIADHSAKGPIILGSDHDLRNTFMLRFYARYLPPDKPLRYHTESRWPALGVDWLIVNETTQAVRPKKRLQVKGNEYRLDKHFPSSGLSPMHWIIYRRVMPGASTLDR